PAKPDRTSASKRESCANQSLCPASTSSSSTTAMPCSATRGTEPSATSWLPLVGSNRGRWLASSATPTSPTYLSSSTHPGRIGHRSPVRAQEHGLVSTQKVDDSTGPLPPTIS